jgi:hypothetical protein
MTVDRTDMGIAPAPNKAPPHIQRIVLVFLCTLLLGHLDRNVGAAAPPTDPAVQATPDSTQLDDSSALNATLPSNSQRLRYLGQTGGIVTDFVVQDDLVFLPEGDALTILRLGGSPLSRISPNQGRIQGLDLAGETVFLITPIGLAAVDVQDPEQPQLLSFLPGGGEAVRIMGDFAFVAARAAGLRVISVSDPRRPVLASTFSLPGKALAIEVDPQMELAYIAADDGGLRIIDVSTPDLPRQVSSMTPAGGVQELELQEGRLSLSNADRILLIDVSRPEDPQLLGTYAPPRHARRIRVMDNIAYVADLDGGLKVFDITEPAQPLLVYAETEGMTYDLVVRGNRAYLADGPDGIRILDISRPARPRLVSRLQLGGIAQGIAVWEDLLLVAAGDAGLYTVNLYRERDPVVMAQWDTDGDARDVKTDGNLAYVADGPAGLKLVSLVRYDSPALRGTLYTAGDAQALGIDGTFLYVAADDGGLQIIDAIHPSTPVLVGTLSLPEGQRAVDVAVVNKRAYLAVQGEHPEEAGLVIADVGFRDQPAILSRVTGPGVGVAVRGVDVFTVEGSELLSIDARASSGPVVQAHYRPPAGAGGLDWAGNTLYLTSGAQGPELSLLDTRNPEQPVELHHFGLTPAGGAVQVAGDHIYLAAGRRGLRALRAPPCPPFCAEGQASDPEEVIYDPMDTLSRVFTDPDQPGRIYGAGEAGWSITNVASSHLPQPLSRMQTDTPVHSLAWISDRFYVASATQGLLIYELPVSAGPPAQATLLGRWAAGTVLQDVLVYDGYVYLLDQQAGIRVVDPNPAPHPSLLQTVPLSGTPYRIIPLEDEGLAYVLTSDGDLKLVDLGHPTAGVISLGQFAAQIATIGVVCSSGSQRADPCPERYAYTLDGGSLDIWRITRDGVEPVYSLTINGTALLLTGQLAFVGSDAGHVSILDTSNPAQPRLAGMMGNNAAVQGMALLPDRMELVVGVNTLAGITQPVNRRPVGLLRIWDIATPLTPAELYSIEVPAPISALVKTADGRRIVTAGESLSLFDITDPLTTTLVSNLRLPAAATTLTLDEDLAYLGTETGLLIVSGLASDSPRILTELPLRDPVLGVAVRGDRGYLALGESGGLILNLSDPTAPREIGRLISPTGGPLLSLVREDDYLWAIWEGAVSWLDISQPRPGPAELGTFSPSGIVATDLIVVGDLAYLTDAEKGLLAYDISDPLAPVALGVLDTPGLAQAVAVGPAGETAFVADGECGIRAIDLQDPSAPTETGFWSTGYALDVATLGDNVYVADIGELMVLEYVPDGPPVPPPAPQSPQPSDGIVFYPPREDPSAPLEATLTWGPPLERCDPVTYDLYFGSRDVPPLVASGLISPAFHVETLERWQTYYWRVAVRDRQGDEITGPLWHFYVETQARPPAVPTRPPTPLLASPPQQDVLVLVGILAGIGTAIGALWWVNDKRAS